MTEWSSAFCESVDLMLKVHDLMRNGQGDSAEANELRAASERPWYAMTEHEQQLIEGLSVDLYSLSEERQELCAADAPGAGEFERYVEVDDWVGGLNILRKYERQVAADIVAAMRGVCWASLGFPNIGRRFFAEAVRLAPQQVPFLMAYIVSLMQDDDLATAQVVAQQVASKSSASAASLIQAGRVFLRTAVDKPANAREPLTRRAMQTLDRGLRGIDSDPIDASFRPMMKEFGLIAKVYGYRILNESRLALEACDELSALPSVDPTEVALLRALIKSDEVLPSEVVAVELQRQIAKESRELNKSVLTLPLAA